MRPDLTPERLRHLIAGGDEAQMQQAIEILRGLGTPPAEIAAWLVEAFPTPLEHPGPLLIACANGDETRAGVAARLLAADCADRLVDLYEQTLHNPRPEVRAAVVAARALASGRLTTAEAVAVATDLPYAGWRGPAQDATSAASWALDPLPFDAAEEAGAKARQGARDLATEADWQRARLAHYLTALLTGADLFSLPPEETP